MKEWTRNDTCRMLGGGIAGVCAQLTGHPFDTIKVRVQAEKAKSGGRSGGIRTMTSMFKEGIRSFWRGAGWPAAMRFVITSSFFAGNGYFRESYIQYLRKKRGLSNDERVLLTPVECGLIAGFTGILLTPMISPIELIKVQLQNDRKSSKFRRSYLAPKQSYIYKNQMDCARVVLKHGQLSRGFLATAFRLVPGWGVYLWVYEHWNRYWDENNVLGSNPVFGALGSLQVLVGGGIAGFFAWFSSYPQDYVKTQIQSHPIEKWNLQRTRKIVTQRLKIRDIIVFTFEQYGIRGFFRGLNVCLVRSFPVNMVNFYVYEFMYQSFNTGFLSFMVPHWD